MATNSANGTPSPTTSTKQATQQAYADVQDSWGVKTAVKTEVGGASFSTISFPQNLGDAQYPHFMIFYINELQTSKFKTPATNAQTNTDRSSIGAESSSTIGQQIITATTGSKAASWVSQAINSGAHFVGQSLDAMGAKGVGSYFDNVKVDFKEIDPQKKRSKYAICLPIPANLSNAISSTYSEINMGPLGGLVVDAISKATADGGTITGAAKGALKGAGINLLRTGTEMLSGGDNYTAMLDKSMGLVQNHRQEMAFRQINMRRFEFNWDLVPRNSTEHDAILDMIKLFKAHMLPEISTVAGNLIMPSEFDIQFRYLDKENPYISKIGTCALEDFTVNYTSSGKFVAAAKTGKPMTINISMRFVEMEPLLRDMVVQKGY